MDAHQSDFAWPRGAAGSAATPCLAPEYLGCPEASLAGLTMWLGLAICCGEKKHRHCDHLPSETDSPISVTPWNLLNIRIPSSLNRIHFRDSSPFPFNLRTLLFFLMPPLVLKSHWNFGALQADSRKTTLFQEHLNCEAYRCLGARSNARNR